MDSNYVRFESIQCDSYRELKIKTKEGREVTIIVDMVNGDRDVV